MKKHLAIFTSEAIKEIFKGSKTVETRFSQKRISPFGEVSSGDLVYIKESGGEIVGQFFVSKVISFDNMETKDLNLIQDNFGKDISLGSKEMDEQFFSNKLNARYGTLLFIDRVEQFIVSPVKIAKKDQRGWVVLS